MADISLMMDGTFVGLSARDIMGKLYGIRCQLYDLVENNKDTDLSCVRCGHCGPGRKSSVVCH